MQCTQPKRIMVQSRNKEQGSHQQHTTGTHLTPNINGEVSKHVVQATSDKQRCPICQAIKLLAGPKSMRVHVQLHVLGPIYRTFDAQSGHTCVLALQCHRTHIDTCHHCMNSSPLQDAISVFELCLCNLVTLQMTRHPRSLLCH